MINLKCDQKLSKLITDLQAGDFIRIELRTIVGGVKVVTTENNSSSTRTYGQGKNVIDITVASTQLQIEISPTGDYVDISDILICRLKYKNCNRAFSNIKMHIEHVGTPRKPINIFNGFARVTTRNSLTGVKTVQDILSNNVGHLSDTFDIDCTKPNTCDYWKSQKAITTSDFKANDSTLISNGLVTSISNYQNWLWSIPSSSNPNGQDSLIISYGNIDQNVVESIELFVLINKIELTEPNNLPPSDSDILNLNDLLLVVNSSSSVGVFGSGQVAVQFKAAKDLSEAQFGAGICDTSSFGVEGCNNYNLGIYSENRLRRGISLCNLPNIGKCIAYGEIDFTIQGPRQSKLNFMNLVDGPKGPELVISNSYDLTTYPTNYQCSEIRRVFDIDDAIIILSSTTDRIRSTRGLFWIKKNDIGTGTLNLRILQAAGFQANSGEPQDMVIFDAIYDGKYGTQLYYDFASKKYNEVTCPIFACLVFDDSAFYLATMEPRPRATDRERSNGRAWKANKLLNLSVIKSKLTEEFITPDIPWANSDLALTNNYVYATTKTRDSFKTYCLVQLNKSTLDYTFIEAPTFTSTPISFNITSIEKYVKNSNEYLLVSFRLSYANLDRYEVWIFKESDSSWSRSSIDSTIDDGTNRVSGPIIDMVQLDGIRSIPTPKCKRYCEPDPSSQLDIVLSYSREGDVGLINKEYKATIDHTDLYSENVDSILEWSKLSTTGNGIKGASAKWLSVKFELDNTIGTGLDQCTTPIDDNEITLYGNITMPSLKMSGSLIFREQCDSLVKVSTIKEGSRTNEKQLLTLPNPTGGTWSITFNNGDTTLTTRQLAYDIDSETLAAELIRLDSIKSISNITVSKTDTIYEVEFKGRYGGTSLPLLIGNGDNLEGCAEYAVISIAEGTYNERQIITKSLSSTQDLIVNFYGAVSDSIKYNSSLNDFQAALERIQTIGTGNVSVTGNIQDRTAKYEGPWIIDFKGRYAGLNVPQITTSSVGYTVNTKWEGGVGANEKQAIVITASGGTYDLDIPDLGEETYRITITGIDYDISDQDLKDLLVANVAYLSSGDLDVTKETSGDTNTWTIEFKGSLANINIGLFRIDGTNLTGGTIVASRSKVGSGTNEITKLEVYKAQAGYFTLIVQNEDGISESNPIAHNFTAQGLADVMAANGVLQYSDIIVSEDTNLEGGRTYLIETGPQAGNIKVSPNYEKTLFCDAANLPFVPEPDYDYEIPVCSEQEDFSFMYEGALFCRPGAGVAEVEPEPSILTDEANKSTSLVLFRDLIDIKEEKSIRQHFLVRNVGENHNIYRLEDDNLVLAQAGELPSNRTVYLAVNKDIDIKVMKNQLLRQVKNLTILPSRSK